MCGIFGSVDKVQFERLYTLNKQRGDFSVSTMGISKDTITMIKSKTFRLPDGVFTFYLGHTRAPTGKNRKFTFHTSHPFINGEWAIAHNGIISNVNELKTKYNIKQQIDVDSQIIPALLTIHKTASEEETIKKVLELLDGIFGVWIVNLKSLNIYIARGASTLYVKDSSFSSANFTDSVLIEDGSLYKLDGSKFVKVLTFNYNSPYYYD